MKRKIAVWGNLYQDQYIDELRNFFGVLRGVCSDVCIEAEFAAYLASKGIETAWMQPIVVTASCGDTRCDLTTLPADTDLVVSIGGDGTFLRAAEWVGNAGVPVMGINTGHLGYLTGFSLRSGFCEENCAELRSALQGDFSVSPRITLSVECEHLPVGFNPIALNEISVSKGDTTSMVEIHTYVDGHFLADYQADGLIVSTPTGSTAYNLSCGGPILQPTLECVVLSPIAPHSLTLRPLAIAAHSEIRLEVRSRGEQCHVGVDGRTFAVPSDRSVLIIRKSSRVVNVAQPTGSYFAEVLRRKLRWGEMPLR